MCFSWLLIEQILIWCIVIGGLFAILRIIIPYALKMLGATVGEGVGIIIQCLKILLWVVVAVFVVTIVFQLIGCLLGSVSLPRLPGR